MHKKRTNEQHDKNEERRGPEGLRSNGGGGRRGCPVDAIKKIPKSKLLKNIKTMCRNTKKRPKGEKKTKTHNLKKKRKMMKMKKEKKQKISSQKWENEKNTKK